MAKSPAHNTPRTVGEVVALLHGAKTKPERAALLKEHNSLALRSILRLNFDPALKFELPEGFPPTYRGNPKPNGFGDTTIKAAVKGFYVFVKTSSPGLRQVKRENLFLQLLEALDRQEAQVLVEAKDKKLEIGLTKKLIDEVFPGLLPVDLKSVKPPTSGESDEASCSD